MSRGRRPLTTLAEWDVYSDLCREYQNAEDTHDREIAFDKIKSFEGVPRPELQRVY